MLMMRSLGRLVKKYLFGLNSDLAEVVRVKILKNQLTSWDYDNFKLTKVADSEYRPYHQILTSMDRFAAYVSNELRCSFIALKPNRGETFSRACTIKGYEVTALNPIGKHGGMVIVAKSFDSVNDTCIFLCHSGFTHWMYQWVPDLVFSNENSPQLQDDWLVNSDAKLHLSFNFNTHILDKACLIKRTTLDADERMELLQHIVDNKLDKLTWTYTYLYYDGAINTERTFLATKEQYEKLTVADIESLIEYTKVNKRTWPTIVQMRVHNSGLQSKDLYY